MSHYQMPIQERSEVSKPPGREGPPLVASETTT